MSNQRIGNPGNHADTPSWAEPASAGGRDDDTREIDVTPCVGVGQVQEGDVASVEGAAFTELGVCAGTLATSMTGGGYSAPRGKKLKTLGNYAAALLLREDLDPDLRADLLRFVNNHHLFGPGSHTESDSGKNGMFSRWARRAEAVRRKHPWVVAVAPFLFNLDVTGAGGRPDGRVEASEVAGILNRIGNGLRNGATIAALAAVAAIAIPSCGVGFEIGRSTAPEKTVGVPVAGPDMISKLGSLALFNPAQSNGVVVASPGAPYFEQQGDGSFKKGGNLATNYGVLLPTSLNGTLEGLLIEGLGTPPEGSSWALMEVDGNTWAVPVDAATPQIPAMVSQHCEGGGNLVTVADSKTGDVVRVVAGVGVPLDASAAAAVSSGSAPITPARAC